MLTICQTETDQDEAHFRELSWEYLQWENARLDEEYGIRYDIKWRTSDLKGQGRAWSQPNSNWGQTKLKEVYHLIHPSDVSTLV
jgi:hypothetical protein